MIYLIICVVVLSGTDLIIGASKKFNNDSLHFSIFNYVAAVGVSAVQVALAAAGEEAARPAFDKSTLLVGFIAGFCYVSNFILKQVCTGKHGAAISAMFTRLCMIVSVLFSVIVFKEKAGLMRWAGFFLAIIALFVYNYGATLKVDKFLIALLVMNGISQCCNNCFTKFCPGTDRPLYAGIANGVAGLVILFCMLRRKERPEWKKSEIFLGLLIGGMSVVCLSMQLLALNTLPASLVFPFTAVAVILLTSIGSRVFFKEKFSKNTLVAFGITIAALVLMNL